MNERNAICDIQKKLREMSYHDGDIPSVAIDGIYGEETRKAVVEFQKKYGLEPNGGVDRTTHDLLKEKYRETLETYGYPEKVSVFPLNPENFVLKKGDMTFATTVLQYMLAESADAPFCLAEISGVYDDATEAAVSKFQNCIGLDETGEVDRRTWNKLANFHNLRAKKYSE